MGKAKSRIPEHIVTAPARKGETCETGTIGTIKWPVIIWNHGINAYLCSWDIWKWWYTWGFVWKWGLALVIIRNHPAIGPPGQKSNISSTRCWRCLWRVGLTYVTRERERECKCRYKFRCWYRYREREGERGKKRRKKMQLPKHGLSSSKPSPRI